MAYPNPYEYQYYPEQASNTGLIVGLALGAVVIAGAGVGAYLYMNQSGPVTKTISAPQDADSNSDPWAGLQDTGSVDESDVPDTTQSQSTIPTEQIGVLKHSSGKCVHPFGGSTNPENGTRLVYFGNCSGDSIKFKMLSNGAFQHVGSGKCIHPQGWFNNRSQDQLHPDNGTNLVLYDGCDAEKNKLKFLSDGSWQQPASGKCVHPISGHAIPDDNDDLVFWDGCGEPKTRVSFVPDQ